MQTEARAPELVIPERDHGRAQLYAGLVLALVVAGIVLRVWVLASSLGQLDSDEAVVGLMANAIRHGHLSTYYWGQNYGGTIEQSLEQFGIEVVANSSDFFSLLVDIKESQPEVVFLTAPDADTPPSACSILTSACLD